MDNFTDILKYIANSNIINFLIMLALLIYVCKKLNLGNSFDQGIENVKSTISKSDEAKALAQNHFDKAQALIDGLPEDIKTLEKNSAQKIDIFKDKIKDNMRKAIENISKNVEKSLSIEEKKISNLLTEKTSKDAIVQAKQNIEKMLEENPELHNQFIENSITELDKAEL